MAPRDSRTPGRAPQVTQPLGLSVPVSPVKGVIWTTGPTIPGTLQKIIFGVESHAHFARQGHGRDDGASIPAYCTHDAAGDLEGDLEGEPTAITVCRRRRGQLLIAASAAALLFRPP